MHFRSYLQGLGTAALLGAAVVWAQGAKVPDDAVLAKVDGEPITKAQLVRRLVEYNGQAALDAMINQAVVRQGAKKVGVEVSDAEVLERLKNVRSRFPSPDAFDKFLESSGVTEEQYRTQVRYTLLTEKIALKVFPLKPDDLDRMVVRVILLNDMAQAKSVLRELNMGSDFKLLAQQRSLDLRSKGEGGLLPPFLRVDRPDVWANAMALQPGKFTKEPVKSGDDYVIIKLEQVLPHTDINKPSEKAALESRVKTYKIGRWLEASRKAAKVEHPIPLKALLEEPQ